MAGSIESPRFGGILIDQEFDAQVQADTRAAALTGLPVSTYLAQSGRLAASVSGVAAPASAGETPLAASRPEQEIRVEPRVF